MEQNNNGFEKLLLEEEKRLSLTTVSSVDEFSEEQLKLTVKGKRVLIKGQNIKICQFDKGNGNLCAEGNIFQIIFLGEKKPFIKKLFS